MPCATADAVKDLTVQELVLEFCAPLAWPHKSGQAGLNLGGIMKRVIGTALGMILLSATFAHAGADIATYKGTYSSSSYCSFVGNADELVSYTTTRALRTEVKTRYEHAADVAASNKAIYSVSPLYEWASQATISCAKSYGYLRKPRKWHKRPDYVMLQKCECFYERMTAYLGR